MSPPPIEDSSVRARALVDVATKKEVDFLKTLDEEKQEKVKEEPVQPHAHHHHHHHHKHSQSWLHFGICVGGIYTFFLTWGLLHERITTVQYGGERFNFFQIMAWAQSTSAALVAVLFLKASGMGTMPQHVRSEGKKSVVRLLSELACLSACSAVASPIGFAALRRLSYPTMILGKSCKLLPVMLMNVVVGGKRFTPIKYLTVLLITVGVGTFMLWDPKGGNKASQSNSWLGLSLLIVNLAFDGVINAWQDGLFVRWRISSQQLMLWMNAFASVAFLGQLLGSQLLVDRQMTEGLAFLRRHPTCLRDLLAFCGCGALGQVFIFLTIEAFGSLTLTTVTVTRKLMTILLSLFLFDHRLSPRQWLSVALVFAALFLEAFAGKK